MTDAVATPSRRPPACGSWTTWPGELTGWGWVVRFEPHSFAPGAPGGHLVLTRPLASAAEYVVARPRRHELHVWVRSGDATGHWARSWTSTSPRPAPPGGPGRRSPPAAAAGGGVGGGPSGVPAARGISAAGRGSYPTSAVDDRRPRPDSCRRTRCWFDPVTPIPPAARAAPPEGGPHRRSPRRGRGGDRGDAGGPGVDRLCSRPAAAPVAAPRTSPPPCRGRPTVSATRRVSRGRVRAESGPDVLTALRQSSAASPDVWVPDSSLWVRRAADEQLVAPVGQESIASSPLMLAVPPGSGTAWRTARQAVGGRGGGARRGGPRPARARRGGRDGRALDGRRPRRR